MITIEQISNTVRNQVQNSDKSFHSWYQFVLGYPPHLIQYYKNKFDITNDHLVLDPFCGTGTTNVECKKLGITSLGLEANPIAYLASTVKTNWKTPVSDLRQALEEVAGLAYNSFVKFNLNEDISLFFKVKHSRSLMEEPRLNEDEESVLPRNFISPRPLRRVLILKACIDAVEAGNIRDLFMIALANVTVNHAGNVAFGPEIYVSKIKKDVQVLEIFLRIVDRMISDLEMKPSFEGKATIVHGDARFVFDFFPKHENKVNFVITSPPYPNEKDYTRTTRLESIVLGLVSNKNDLRSLKNQLLRSNSRNIFAADEDQNHVKGFESINRIANEIEQRRLDLKKTSGFEKQYHKIVKHYFGGMYLHLKSLKPLLTRNARLAYVVGDQMSFFRIHIPTAKILGEIAESLNYQIDEIELWRTRIATATKQQINENTLILKNS